jgi:hypothetical protein
MKRKWERVSRERKARNLGEKARARRGVRKGKSEWVDGKGCLRQGRQDREDAKLKERTGIGGKGYGRKGSRVTIYHKKYNPLHENY